MTEAFADPSNFLPKGAMTWLTDIQPPARIKHGPNGPSKFIVREPDGNGGYLSIGQESDFPGLDEVVTTDPHNFVIATMVKERFTTFHAVDAVAKRLSKALGRYINPDDISYCGLKDNWAQTTQLICIAGVTCDEVKSVRWEHNLGRQTLFLKDIRPAQRPLNKGEHGFNRFEIVVDVPGHSAAQIAEHVNPVVRKLLNDRNSRALNAVGRQRLGKRQNLHRVGRVLLTGDLDVPVGRGVPPFNTALEAATYMFLFDIGPEKPLAVETRTRLEPCWLFNFEEMRAQLDRVYWKANMSFELKIIERLANVDKYGGSFEAVMRSMRNEYSLWCGAWQTYWWNQVLSHLVEQYRLGLHEEIPLPMCTQLSLSYFLQVSRSFPDIYVMLDELWKTKKFSREMPQSVAHANRIIEEAIRAMSETDCVTRLMFLVPRTLIDDRSRDTAHVQLRKAALATHNKYNKRVKGPKREAMVEIRHLEYTCHDGELRVQFELGSGAYATTFLGQIFDLIDPDDPAIAVSGPIEDEETAPEVASVA